MVNARLAVSLYGVIRRTNRGAISSNSARRHDGINAPFPGRILGVGGLAFEPIHYRDGSNLTQLSGVRSVGRCLLSSRRGRCHTPLNRFSCLLRAPRRTRSLFLGGALSRGAGLRTFNIAGLRFSPDDRIRSLCWNNGAGGGRLLCSRIPAQSRRDWRR
jgi:hypothetical protein